MCALDARMCLLEPAALLNCTVITFFRALAVD
jgi:hypothetical protein